MIGIAICILAIMLVLGIAFYISYNNTDNQLKKQSQIYKELKKQVIESIRDNAHYINQEIDNVYSTMPNIFVEKIEINNSEDIYELSSIYTKTDIATKNLKNAIKNEVDKRNAMPIRCIELYPSKLEDTNILINKYNNTITEIHKISRTFFGNSLIVKYGLKDIEKIIV